MTNEQLTADIRDANVTYLMLAQNLIRQDKAEAPQCQKSRQRCSNKTACQHPDGRPVCRVHVSADFLHYLQLQLRSLPWLQKVF